jgi:hypothetical protein
MVHGGQQQFKVGLAKLTEQLMWPLYIVSPSEKQKFKLFPTTPCLYSGSALTTAANTIASSSIAVACSLTGGSQDELKQAAYTAGFKVTVKECTKIEDLDFLKHFPVRIAGVIYPVLCQGVIVRTFGKKRRNFQWKKYGYLQSGYNFNCNLTAAYKVQAPTLITRSLIESFPPTTPYYTSYLLGSMAKDLSVPDVPIQSLIRRYNLTMKDVAHAI